MIKFWKWNKGGIKYMKSPWGRFEFSENDVRRYYTKNDEYEVNIPLQIAQKLLDETANELVRMNTENALDLARAQGMLQGISKVALELAKMNRVAKDRFAVAGGMLSDRKEKDNDDA